MTRYLTSEIAREISIKYDGTTEKINELVKKYNIPRHVILEYARRNKLNKKSIHYWTDNEVSFLINNAWKGRKYVSKKLNRSQTSVRKKAWSLGVGNFYRRSSYYFGTQAAAELLGVSPRTVIEWIWKKLLKCKIATTSRKIYLIEVKELERFLEAHQDMWDSRRMKGSLWLNDPEWLKDKKKTDFNRPVPKQWTVREEQQLILMHTKECLTLKQIAKKLGRSISSVRNKFTRINNMQYSEIFKTG